MESIASKPVHPYVLKERELSEELKRTHNKRILVERRTVGEIAYLEETVRSLHSLALGKTEPCYLIQEAHSTISQAIPLLSGPVQGFQILSGPQAHPGSLMGPERDPEGRF